MLKVKAEIKPSGTDCIGLFALEDIPKGAVVITPSTVGLDIELAEEDFKKLKSEEQEYILHYGFINKFTGKYHLTFDNTRFMNHSTNSNVVLDETTGNLLATRDIAVGEELTQNYSDFESLRDSLKT